MMHTETLTALHLRCLMPSLPGAPSRKSPAFDDKALAAGPADAASFDTLAEALAAILDHAASGWLA